VGFSLLLFSLILFFIVILAAFVGKQKNNDDPYEGLSIDEWNCPECGFFVQAGNRCIYCDYTKDNQ
jgi:rubrerythrin